MNYQVVAISTGKPAQDYYCYDEFFASLKKYDCTPLVITPDKSKRFGLGDKVKLLHKAILSGDVYADHVIFADCFDLVFAASPGAIINQFKTFNAPFVCSAEKNCFPGDLREYFPASPTSYKYLNSGFIVAERDALLVVLESMGPNNIPDDYYDTEKGCNVHFNDQLFYMEQFIQQPVDMVLDYNQELSQTMHEVGLTELDFTNPDGIKNIETGMYPMSFHFNGNAKSSGTRQPILKHLGL
jgi:hypothetical protein